MRQVQVPLNKRVLTSGSLLASALLYALLGGLLFFRHQMVYSAFRLLSAALLALSAVLGLLACLLGRRRKLRSMRRLLTALVSLCGAWLAWTRPRSLLVLLPLALALNALVSGTLLLTNCVLRHRGGEWVSSGSLLFGVLLMIFGVALLINPTAYINAAASTAGVYCILLALTQFADYREERRFARTRAHAPRKKRRTRFALPGFFTALVPKRQQGRVERYLNRLQEREQPAGTGGKAPAEAPADFEIFIHATEKGLGSVGHVDICFEDIVRTYGPYDRETHRLKGLICRGVLAVVQGRERYLDFCTRYSKKTIFCYGIALTDIQRELVRKATAELMQEVVIWHPPHRRDPAAGHDDYASMLLKELDAQLYHFAKGGFQIYFMGGANCAVLADRIVGALGTDIPSPTGLLTPGAYFNYLDREYRRPNSIITTKRVYRAS